MLCVRERGISFPGEAAERKRIRRFAGVVRARFLETLGGAKAPLQDQMTFSMGCRALSVVDFDLNTAVVDIHVDVEFGYPVARLPIDNHRGISNFLVNVDVVNTPLVIDFATARR